MDDHDHDDHLDETDPSFLSTLSGIEETNDDVLLQLQLVAVFVVCAVLSREEWKLFSAFVWLADCPRATIIRNIKSRSIAHSRKQEDDSAKSQFASLNIPKRFQAETYS
jgi:hypothetical protein